MVSKISQFTINCHESITELCVIGGHTGTDKSPINARTTHRHPYTPIYNMLFAPFEEREITMGEIGVAAGASVALWRAYFTKAHLFFYDRDENFLNFSRARNFKDTSLHLMDVKETQSICDGLAKAEGGFDILIDDSSHDFDDQIRIIHAAIPYLKSGGILIVEDIFRKRPETDYAKKLEGVFDQFSFAAFFTCEHIYKFSGDWDNDKLLYLVKI